MLFTNIAALVAKGVTIHITVSAAAEGQLEVAVVPTADSGKAGMGLVPRSFTATPAELDAEFPEIMRAYANANLTLKQQLDAANEAIEEAGKAAAASAAAKKEKTAHKPAVGKTTGAAAPALAPSLETDDEGSGDGTASETSEGAPVVFDL